MVSILGIVIFVLNVITLYYDYIIMSFVLLILDVVDFRLEFDDFNFMKNKIFYIYYFSRYLLLIIVYEVALNTNILNTNNTVLLSLIMPIVFISVFQNIVVQFGGEEKIDLQDNFIKFREKVVLSLYRIDMTNKAKLKQKILDTDISLNDLLNEYRFYTTNAQYFDFLRNITNFDIQEQKIRCIEKIYAVGGEEALLSIGS
ncbi:MAG: hypothetical protein NWF07_14800 [Candidatus Bathyarchaeota archaeon]|nr:hypothetical protein [Candidatus Bathyarchaeota archaeon]